MNIESAEQILKVKTPGEIFTGDKDVIKTEFKNLVKKWHPDQNPSKRANDVFLHIKSLYDKALEMLEKGRWEGKNEIQLQDHYGSTYKIRYYIAHPFELGLMYISDKIVAYVLDKEYEDLYKNGERMMKFTYPNEKIKEEVSKYLPSILSPFKTLDDKLVMVVQKTPDLLLLKDVLKYFNGVIPEKHTAWILSSLYNLTCYFQVSNLSHNAINLDNYFISPLYHSGALLGGWWYARKEGDKLIGVPKTTFDLIPPDVLRNKIASHKIDLELIRAVGREILGDPTGANLKRNKVAPEPMINWLKLTSDNKPIKEYELWGKVLDKCYGKRKFIKLELTSKELYKDLI